MHAKGQRTGTPTLAALDPTLQCAQCGRTFSTDEKVAKHAKTCKGGAAPVAPPPAQKSEAQRIFDLIDGAGDGNGVISLEELTVYQLEQVPACST
jgi:hypothetical protein